MPPYNQYGKVPGLSHYFHDIVPYYLCCHWSDQCESYLYLRQTKDAVGYKEPKTGLEVYFFKFHMTFMLNNHFLNPAVAYGDPHLITFGN